MVGFSGNVLAAIANKVGEAGDHCGIEFVKGFRVSDRPSKVKVIVRLVVKARVQFTRYEGIWHCCICTNILGFVLLNAPSMSCVRRDGRDPGGIFSALLIGDASTV